MVRALLLILALAGCAGAPPSPSVALCRLQVLANLPATSNGNRLQVEAHVNGVEARFLVDTGAQQSVLTTATVAALHLPRSTVSGTLLAGLGGAVLNADTYATLQLGALALQGKFAVADLPAFDGIIGADILSVFDLELDIPYGRVRLWQAENCGITDLPWEGPRATLPVQVNPGARLTLPVLLDGQAVTAVLDSGATNSLVQATVARDAGVTQAALAADPRAEAQGVGGTPLVVRAHRFGSLTVGGDRIDNPVIAVAEFRLPIAVQMLLGMDYLRVRRVWISYRTAQLFIQEPKVGG